ncbi:pi038 [Candida margitis]|uniref:pi038 n=1 Tax=Candida margitis TaxID=1775924 RepID=UPI00222685AB|nr:pi038 [Candida margitis]KAI5967758.1 pi038 [Candida margitis]
MHHLCKRLTRNMTWRPRYFDIGVNFSDSMFQGFYNGSPTPKHPCDIEDVINRAHLFNVDRMLITASTIKESRDHLGLCEQYKNQFSSTAGVHPCSVANEFYVKEEDSFTEELRPDVSEKLAELKSILIEGYNSGHVKAFGEIGLDYDRLHYSSKHQQLEMFKRQLDILKEIQFRIPLFLHMRAACDDFINIIKPYIDDGTVENGVVHSFTGTEEELNKLLELGFYIGVNGCSLKTEENLVVASKIPVDKLMIETDAPWCEIRKSHASYKFISPYPNIFYPAISTGELNEAKPQFKLDDNLPFPSIKKEHYTKHSMYVQQRLENWREEAPAETRVGVLSRPLIKSRNEPAQVGHVAEILCKLNDITDDSDIEKFIDRVFENSVKVFH